jgi:hypothetical protein
VAELDGPTRRLGSVEWLGLLKSTAGGSGGADGTEVAREISGAPNIWCNRFGGFETPVCLYFFTNTYTIYRAGMFLKQIHVRWTWREVMQVKLVARNDVTPMTSRERSDGQDRPTASLPRLPKFGPARQKTAPLSTIPVTDRTHAPSRLNHSSHATRPG